MKYTFLILIFITLGFSNGYAQKVNGNDTTKSDSAKYPSLLWEITGNGLDKPSYLYGTMHVSKKLAFHLNDTFFIALNNCDVVALETNPGEWMQNYSNSEHMHKSVYNSSKYSSYRYSSFYQNAFMISFPEEDDFAYLLGREYDVMNSMLYRTYDSEADFEEKTYLDLFIFQAGSKLGKEVTSLEGFEESRKLVEEARRPPKKKEKRKRGKAYRDLNRYSIGEKIEDAYRRGDLDMLDSISRMMDPSEKYSTYMLTKRNILMANTIDSVSQAGKPIFAACGAAHLPGDSGVIELLRNMGYHVRPIKKTLNERQHKEKAKIDKIVIDHQFNSFTSPNGTFSVLIPEKLYSDPLFSNYGEFLYPDMVNGAYYVVNRFPHYGPLFNKSQKDMRLKVDSLLYEYIPGEIVNRENKEIAGFPVYDILNKTNIGDYQRYNIVFTPLEIIVFKMSGTGEFVKESDAANKFFNSISINIDQDSDWTTYEPHHGGYKLDIPAYTFLDTSLVLGTQTKDIQLQAYDFKDSCYYGLIKSCYHDFDYIEEDTFELNMLAEQFAEKLPFDLKERKLTSAGGYPAVDFYLKHEKKDDQFIHGRIIINGPAYYLLFAKPQDSIRPERFFENFAFTPYNYHNKFRTHTDTSLHYTAETVNLPPEYRESSYYGYYGYYNDDEEEDDSHESEKKSSYVVFKPTGEHIDIDFHKLHKYDSYDNLKDLWEDKLEDITNDSDMVIKNVVYSDSGLVNTMTLSVTDTNSGRMIYVKYIQKHGAVYQLTSLTDTLSGISDFTTKFYETFTPSEDTLIGWNIFDDKGVLYLEDLNGQDSTKRAQARGSFNEIVFDDKDAPALMKVIANPNYDEFKLTLRADMITDLGYLENDSIIDFLKNLYPKYKDTISLQLAIIGAISEQENVEAFKTVLELMAADLPLTSDDYDITKLFAYHFKDSIELCQHLYPEIFKHARFREYEGEIYSLAMHLVDSNIVSKKLIASQYSNIYRNVRDEWKRYLSRQEDRIDDSKTYYSYSSGPSSELRTYTSLLRYFYADRDKPEVKQMFNKLLSVKDMDLRLMAAVQLEQKGHEVNDSIWPSLAKSNATRTELYHALRKMEKLELFDTTYLNQKDFAYAYLYDDDFDKDEDSTEFICKRRIANKYGDGMVYFFKSKKERDKEWRIGYMGLMDTVSTSVKVIYYTSSSRSERIYADDDIDELIEKEVQKIRLKGRERASSYDFSAWLFNYFLL